MVLLGWVASVFATVDLCCGWERPTYGYNVERGLVLDNASAVESLPQTWRGYYFYGNRYEKKDQEMRMTIRFEGGGSIVGSGVDQHGDFTLSGKWGIREKEAYSWLKSLFSKTADECPVIRGELFVAMSKVYKVLCVAHFFFSFSSSPSKNQSPHLLQRDSTSSHPFPAWD